MLTVFLCGLSVASDNVGNLTVFFCFLGFLETIHMCFLLFFSIFSVVLKSNLSPLLNGIIDTMNTEAERRSLIIGGV